jgi:hypothetical protein
MAAVFWFVNRFDLSDSQTKSSSISMSFAPIQKSPPFLSVRKFTDDEIMKVLWLRQTVHNQGYFIIVHTIYYCWRILDATKTKKKMGLNIWNVAEHKRNVLVKNNQYLECIQLYSLCMFSSVDGKLLFNKIHDLLWWETSVVMNITDILWPHCDILINVLVLQYTIVEEY